MSTMQMLNTFVENRLTVAAAEIFVIVERTREDYQNEVVRVKLENDRLTKLLHLVSQPEHNLDTKVFRTDDLQVFVCGEEHSPELQERNPSSDREDPETRQFKTEQEEQCHQKEEAFGSQSTAPPLKCENEEYGGQRSQMSQTVREETVAADPPTSTSSEKIIAEPGKEECEPTEPVGDVEPARDDQPPSTYCTKTKKQDCGDFCTETRELQPVVNILRPKKAHSRLGSSTSKRFSKSMELLPEQKLSHSISSMCFCKVCGESLPNISSLSRNSRVHLTMCGFCGKDLEPTESLSQHLRGHRSCDFCGKVFTTLHSLQRHLRIHSGDRPFGCMVCGKRFIQKGHLLSHRIVHTAERPYSCSVCQKTFGERSAVKLHMRSHSGEKPFSCSVCHRNF